MWIFNHFVPCNGCPLRRFLQVIFDIVDGIANESAWVWACPEFGPWEMAEVGERWWCSVEVTSLRGVGVGGEQG